MNKALVLDPDVLKEMVRDRHERGIDLYDEVWDGVYVMPSMPNLGHQQLVHDLEIPLDVVVVQEKRGHVYPGANVSDRRSGWKENFRVPDIVVVLKNSRAIACEAHFYGGPDFLIEIESPDEDIDLKFDFYSRIQVQELLIIHRDTRQLRLYRHDGQQLVPVQRTAFQGGKWLVSAVVPLAFRRKVTRGGPRTEVRRTDGKPGRWTV
jgi:Uma2 family endonuclease